MEGTFIRGNGFGSTHRSRQPSILVTCYSYLTLLISLRAFNNRHCFPLSMLISDFASASKDDVVAEVKRLRTLLHTYTVTVSETKGLEVVWMMLSDGQLCIDVSTLVSASEKMTGAGMSEDEVKAKLKELSIAEGAIDFDAFVKFFSTEKSSGVGLTFEQIAVSISMFFSAPPAVKPLPCFYYSIVWPRFTVILYLLAEREGSD